MAASGALGSEALAAIEAAVERSSKKRGVVVGSVIWSPLRALITFGLAALLVAIVAWYVGHFSHYVSEVLIAVASLVVGGALATVYYELARR